MKYIVIYNMDNAKSAFCFDSHDDAVDYINACSEAADQYVDAIYTVDEDTHKMVFKNGKEVGILIREYKDSAVRFDLVYDKNGRHIETRRFSKRNLAVDYANKMIDDLGFTVDENENEFSDWNLKDEEENVDIHLWLKLVILGEKSSSEYDVLGVKSTDSMEDIKSAYRKLAIKYHPDKGGDPEKFQEIHDAYERIVNGKAKKGSKQNIIEEFACMDMRRVFSSADARQAKELESVYPILRAKAAKIIGLGIVFLLIGGALTGMSYQGTKPGNRFTVFTGLIFVGIYDIVRGLYYLANPKAMIKKK